MVHQVVVCLLAISALYSLLKTSLEGSLNSYPVMDGDNYPSIL